MTLGYGAGEVAGQRPSGYWELQRDWSAHVMPWAPPPKRNKSGCQVFSLKAATDYTEVSCPTDKHPASSQDTQSRPAAPEES